MAEYHLSLKIGAKGKAAPHYHYITATGKYVKKSGVVHIESGNMPFWAAAQPVLFWEASDEYERANGTTYRELEVALPRELPLPIQFDLARQLAAEVCGKRHPYTFAIHHTEASDGGLNPHVHIEFSERIQDGIDRDMTTFFRRANKKHPEKGGCLKDRSWQAITHGRQKHGAEACERLLEIREKWASMCNQALESNCFDARVDHRSHLARDIYLLPQPKVGAKSWHLYKRTGVKNERFSHYEDIVGCNNDIRTEVASITSVEEMLADARQRLIEMENELVSLKKEESQIIDDQKAIQDELLLLSGKPPIVRSRAAIIRAMFVETRTAKQAKKTLSQAKSKLRRADSRFNAYCKIMDAPLTWSNFKSKVLCWWQHSSRSDEEMYLSEARQAYQNAHHRYSKLQNKELCQSDMIAKADAVTSREQNALAFWKRNIDALKERLSQLDKALNAIQTSIALMQSRRADGALPAAPPTV